MAGRGRISPLTLAALYWLGTGLILAGRIVNGFDDPLWLGVAVAAFFALACANLIRELARRR